MHDLEFRWRRMGLNYEQRRATLELARNIWPVAAVTPDEVARVLLDRPPPKPPKPAEPTYS